ncbi:MAG: phosphate signaling complex protein PhoU [Kiritimatiellae bacterium]|nr:phosphate signaling complex protein PhoU [Kiritimatiellia bacterium]
MSVHLQRELDRLKKLILSLSAVVEGNLAQAVRSVQLRDDGIARHVIQKDEDIDHLEVEVEEECLKILALHQPVAIDLRYIIAVLKLNNDLERIGDLAVNIAERTLFLSRENPPAIPFDFEGMVEKTRNMLRQALDALVNMDTGLAQKVCAEDDEVDAINRDMYEQVKDAIRKHPQDLDALIHLLGVSRYLERIADHATNIAEDIIYMIQGKIIRHRAEEYR